MESCSTSHLRPYPLSLRQMGIFLKLGYTEHGSKVGVGPRSVYPTILNSLIFFDVFLIQPEHVQEDGLSTALLL